MVINSDIDVYEKKKEKGKLEERADEVFLGKIKQKTTELNTLIETLFLLTRAEENISKLTFRKRDIGKIIQGLLDTKVSDHNNKEIQLHSIYSHES